MVKGQDGLSPRLGVCVWDPLTQERGRLQQNVGNSPESPGEDLRETDSQPASGAVETLIKGNPGRGVLEDVGNRERDLQPRF